MALTGTNIAKLKRLGLSHLMFNEDEFKKAALLYDEVKKRIAEMEQSDEWKDVDLPWNLDRAQYLAEEAEGLHDDYVPGIEIMHPPVAAWSGCFGDWMKHMERGLGHAPKRDWSSVGKRGQQKKNQQRGSDSELIS